MRQGLRAVALIAAVLVTAPVLAQRPAASVAALGVSGGTELDVLLHTGLNSGVAKVDQRFEAVTLADLHVGDVVVMPAGSVLRGFVSSARASSSFEHKGTLTLSFDDVLIGGTAMPVRASVVQTLDGRQNPDRPGANVPGATRPSLLGVIVTGNGTIASTQAADVDLPAGTILRIRIDKPLI